MDTQSIGPVGGPLQGSQGQASVPPNDGGASMQSAAAAMAVQNANASKPAGDGVRARDPRSLQFQVDSSTRQVVTTIVDENNQTVVVQIPDEEVLRIAKAIDRMKGFLLEGKA